MSRYIDDSRADGAQPVLVTSIVRRNFTTQGKIAVDSLPPFVIEGPEVCAEIDARDDKGASDHTISDPKSSMKLGPWPRANW